MSSSLNMPVPPEGDCTRQYSASSREQIVASDHGLGLLRRATRVPPGHLLSRLGAPNTGTLEAAGSLPVAAASSAPALGGASICSRIFFVRISRATGPPRQVRPGQTGQPG